MKIGVVGKGGVGKTTVAALLARAYADRRDRVVAVDTDSNPNLGLSLGLSAGEVDAVPALPRAALVGTGSAGATTAGSLLEEYGRPTPSGVTLLTGLRVDRAGGGCTCGGHATVRSLLGEALEAHADVTVVDMEAGLEHLSRSGGTLASADVLLVVMEPSRKSVLTAVRTLALAEELGIPRTVGLGNKAEVPADVRFFADATAEHGLPLAGVLPRHPAIADAERTGAVIEPPEPVRAELDRVIRFLDDLLVGDGPTAS